MAVSLLPLILAAAAFGSSPVNPVATARCDVRVTPTAEGLRVDGVVHGRRGDSGSYELRVEKSGAAGSSQVAQAGAFTIPATTEAVVSETEFSVTHSDVYSIRMIVTGKAGATRCERRAP